MSKLSRFVQNKTDLVSTDSEITMYITVMIQNVRFKQYSALLEVIALCKEEKYQYIQSANISSIVSEYMVMVMENCNDFFLSSSILL